MRGRLGHRRCQRESFPSGRSYYFAVAASRQVAGTSAMPSRPRRGACGMIRYQSSSRGGILMSCVDSVRISSGGLLRRVSEFWSLIAERDRGAEICVGRLDISSPGRGGDWSSIKLTNIQPRCHLRIVKSYPNIMSSSVDGSAVQNPLSVILTGPTRRNRLSTRDPQRPCIRLIWS
jgi:hypothetical protein